VVQYTENSCLVVAVHFAIPQLAARVVDNLVWNARYTHPTSEIYHSGSGSWGWVFMEGGHHTIDMGVMDCLESGCWRGCSAT
jgi:hypothetical protein